MTQNEKLINIAGLTYVLRDILEDSDFDREMKMRVNNFTAYLNKKVEQIAGNDPEVWEQLEQLVKHFYDNLVTEEG